MTELLTRQVEGTQVEGVYTPTDAEAAMVDYFGRLASDYGFPAGAVALPLLKSFANTGNVTPEQLAYAARASGKTANHLIDVGTFYDHINPAFEEVAGDDYAPASGTASDELFESLGGNAELSILQRGPLTEHIGPDSHKLESYGGPNAELKPNTRYVAARKASGMQPSQIIDEVVASNLNGRGGAEFPVGQKWESAAESIAKKQEKPFLICNADEGEPPTRKDRLLMEGNPHAIIEGLVIGAQALGAEVAIIYIRGDYTESIKRLNSAIEEAREANLLGNLKEIVVYEGGGSYVCGNATALIQSMEGNRGRSQSTPPRMTHQGLAGRPTVVNNVESWANIPEIIKNGGKAFSQIGDPKHPGTRILQVCGDVKKPGFAEVPTGKETVANLITMAGGPTGTVKAVQVGGASSKLLTAEDLDTIVTPTELQSKGTELGSGTLSVLSTDRNMLRMAQESINFYSNEYCGNCTACPHGIKLARVALGRLARNENDENTEEILESITTRSRLMSERLSPEQKEAMGVDPSREENERPRCGLGRSALNFTRSAISKFPEDFRIEGGQPK